MTRLAMSVMVGLLRYTAMASQSQIPLRVGDCVEATTDLEFFYKDEGEYERTHLVRKNQAGVLLNVDSSWTIPSTVEFLDKKTREPVVAGAVFLYQFARVPWSQGQIKETGGANTCMTVVDGNKDYQPVVKMSECATDDTGKWKQQFSFNRHDCGPRPIRLTKDPSKCVDAVHPQKVLLTDCSGADSQKFEMRCENQDSDCHLLAMGGRKDMCLHWTGADADLQLRTCNFGTLPTTTKRFATLSRPMVSDHKRDNWM